MIEGPNLKINNIKKLKSDIYFAESAIEEMKTKQKQLTGLFDPQSEVLEQQIQYLEDDIDTAQSDIDEIKHTLIKSELVDIIDSVAKVWNVTPEEIIVSCSSTKPLINSLTKYFSKNNINQSKTFLQIKLSPPKRMSKTAAKIFSCTYEGHEPQKDGKSLESHLVPKYYRVVLGEYCIVSEFDNYKQLITQFTLNDLIIEMPEESEISLSTPLSEIIFDASEKYIKKHGQEFIQESIYE